jgi:demethylmenaquinone methyltransferase/2-methoxy-6-polyprenyl-1,4-benzoquinol methylase
MASLMGPERARYVRTMFARIAPRYDLLNTVMTGGLDAVWRRQAVAWAALPDGGTALDVGTGTGKLAIALARSAPTAHVVGVDFTEPMLRLGARRARDLGLEGVHWVLGDALALPFPSERFDCVVSAFTVRNVGNLALAFAEMARVTRPGGRVVCLEATLSGSGLVGVVAQRYFRRAVPFLGQVLAGDREAYTYLPESVQQFPDAEGLATVMREAGLVRVQYRVLGFGMVALHLGWKPR